eukprot:55613-Chlamydomonas_euryale.AAC.2
MSHTSPCHSSSRPPPFHTACGADALTTGMLVVDSIVPGGPADGKLEVWLCTTSTQTGTREWRGAAERRDLGSWV